MNPYLISLFHQLNIVVNSIVAITEHLNERELDVRPVEGRRSIRELLTHIALICKADLLILNEATLQEMDHYYNENSPQTLAEIREILVRNYTDLIEEFSKYSEKELHITKKSYWGVTYTRYEWLLEILCHLNHHRGQLHTLITQNLKELNVALFE